MKTIKWGLESWRLLLLVLFFLRWGRLRSIYKLYSKEKVRKTNNAEKDKERINAAGIRSKAEVGRLTLEEKSREGRVGMATDTFGKLRELPLKGIYFLYKIRGIMLSE